MGDPLVFFGNQLGVSMALMILLGVVRVTVSAANAVSSSYSAVVAEMLAAVIALIDPHP